MFKAILDPKDLKATKAAQELILLFKDLNDLQDLKSANATKGIKDL